MTVVRYRELINGRNYVIEVLPVASNRWRAQLVRRPDRATALMPFYGVSPDEAAAQLRGWLSKATATKTA